jgi:hypothetical protein
MGRTLLLLKSKQFLLHYRDNNSFDPATDFGHKIFTISVAYWVVGYCLKMFRGPGQILVILGH